MNLQHLRNKESVHLWCAIVITLVLAAYRLSQDLISQVRAFFQPYTALPIADWLNNFLFFWLLALLWFAYRRWRDTLGQRKELEMVIAGLSPDVLMVIGPDRVITMCNEGVRTMLESLSPQANDLDMIGPYGYCADLSRSWPIGWSGRSTRASKNSVFTWEPRPGSARTATRFRWRLSPAG